MATGQVTRFLEELRSMGPQPRAVTDGELLGAFISHRDEAAFEALVRRHGPMVLSVCRRVLGEVHDAEDAFQATFLVLARKAASIRHRQTVSSWLHGVAHRTALHANRSRSRRQSREKQVIDMPHPTVASAESLADWQPLLDRELSAMPEKYRLPIVLCDLEGRSRKEVAGQLRIPEGTLSNRLTTARQMLAQRLARQGFAVSAAAVMSLLGQQTAVASVPPILIGATVKAAVAFSVSAVVQASTRVTALTEGVLKTMLLSELRSVLIIGIAVSLLGLAGGLSSLHSAAGQPAPGVDPTTSPGEQPAAGAKGDTTGSGKGGKDGKPLKQLKKEIDEAMEKLMAAKDQAAEKKAFQELQQATAALKENLDEKWGVKNPPKLPAVKITGEKLVQAYLDNQADADDRFVNKNIEVSGTLSKVFRAPKGFETDPGVADYVVEISFNKVPFVFRPLQFLFAESQKKELAGLKPGQTVTIQANCRGVVPERITHDGTTVKSMSIRFGSCKLISAEK